ncbi:tyrosine kinase receptor Cad96Ca-like [Glandiceps talaboti]
MYAINNHITQRAENADMNSNRVAYSPISEHSVIDISINTNNQTTEDSLLVHDEWEFPREKLYFFGLSLGQGEFGEVKRADAVNIRGHPGSTEVAVKTLHANSSKEDKRNFLRELLLMKSFSTGHPNVVSLLGCCTESEPILIIVELAKHGSLQNYLRKVREDYTYANLDEECQSIPTKDLLQFAWQIAKGMSFLTTNGCVHRDLATRNILLGENRTCKISDFGLARDVTSEMIYRRKSEVG